MPHITSSEIAVVSAAFVFFYFIPAALAWSDDLRRRRLRRQERRLDMQASSTAVYGTTPATSSMPTGELPDTIPPTAGVELPTLGSSQLHDEVAEVVAAADLAVASEGALEAHPEPEMSDGTSVQAEPPAALLVPGLQPLVGPAHHHFRLQDLHRTQLPDWPPDVVRHDPERSRLWQEAERTADEHRSAIESATIHSPYPARAVCLGAAEVDGSTVRLRYLLFPSLWPVSQNQAVAQAIFEVDRARGAIRGWVDALAPSELSEENRHEIRESGGEV